VLSGWPTVASLDTPTWIRARWEGTRTESSIVLLLGDYFRRFLSGELTWR
jgi:hypothetical protein